MCKESSLFADVRKGGDTGSLKFYPNQLGLSLEITGDEDAFDYDDDSFFGTQKDDQVNRTLNWIKKK